MSDQPTAAGSAAPAAPAPRNRRRLIVLTSLVLAFAIIGIAWGAHWYTVGRFHVATDDAYVQGNIIQITPQVSG